VKPGRSSIVALDRQTGEIRWQTRRKSTVATYSAPCILRRKDGPDELILLSRSHGIDSLDPRTGLENWEMPVIDKRTVGSPLVAAGLVFGTTGSGGGGNYVVAVRPGKGKTPQVAYTIKQHAPYATTLVANGELVFLWYDKGIVTCIHGPSGKVIWKQRVGGNYFGSPVRVQDRLYCISEAGDVVVLAAGREFKLLARNPLGQSSRATPAIAGGRMYLRTLSRLICVGGGKTKTRE